MKIQQILAATLCTGTLFILQGCGGGGGDSTTAITTTSGKSPASKATTSGKSPASKATTTPAGATTTTTTRSNGKDSKPLTIDQALEYLNSNYKGYKEGVEESSVGVVLRMTPSWYTFFCDGFHPEDFKKPGFPGVYQGCHNGQCECITSASILNHQVMLKNVDQMNFGLKQKVGMVFNTSLVETKLGRCSYEYDGGITYRLNRGCGGTPTPTKKDWCKDTSSAWFDEDPKTHKKTTDTSELVLKDYCPVRSQAGQPVHNHKDPPCYWKGPAWSKTGNSGKSETHKMMSQRVDNQKKGSDLGIWNEVVIDLNLLLEELQRDPAQVVLAIVYEDSGDATQKPISKAGAEKMARDMKAEFNMKDLVPVIAGDTRLHVKAQPNVPGPFFHGKHWSTQTTTTLPRTTAACCEGSCEGKDKDPNKGYCSKNEANCKDCSGVWCPAPSMV